jgi:TPR repeat protein
MRKVTKRVLERRVPPYFPSQFARPLAIGGVLLAGVLGAFLLLNLTQQEHSTLPMREVEQQAPSAGLPEVGQPSSVAPGTSIPVSGVQEAAPTKGPLRLCIVEGLAASCEEICEKGNAVGCIQLGHMYMNALSGVSKDENRARVLYQKACEANNGEACGYLAWMYEHGRGGVSKDEGQAASLYQNGCTADSAYACIGLAYFYESGRGGLPDDDTIAIRMYEKGCDLYDWEGCASAANLYIQDKGLQKNEARALALYQKACENGNLRGCTGLAWIYEQGVGGVSKDVTRALALYQKACDGRNVYACRNLKSLLGK